MRIVNEICYIYITNDKFRSIHARAAKSDEFIRVSNKEEHNDY